MLSYSFYKILHLTGLMLLFFGLGGMLMAAYGRVELKKAARIMGFVAHGVGLLFILVSGFGMAARLGLVTGLPGWVHAKLGIWVLMGIIVSVIKRKGYIGWPLAILIWGLGISAAIVAINKPF